MLLTDRQNDMLCGASGPNFCTWPKCYLAPWAHQLLRFENFSLPS